MSFLRSVVSQSSWFCPNTCFHSGHQQVSNPIIPYVGPIISDELKPGMALYVQGAVPDNAKQFTINLQTGQNKYDDIAFHFNPWISQYVYLNSFQNGNWEVKECVPDVSFTRGAAFNMFIVITTDGYEVYVNDLKHYTFQHRIPLENVTTLGICGDVNIEFFGLCENWRRSCFTEQAIISTGCSLSNMLPIPSEVSHHIIQPVLPHVDKIRDGLKPGMAIFFQGALPAHPKEFEINFQTGQSDSDDIAFHFNPHIGTNVYLNSFRNGCWEKEECVSDEFFTKGSAFYMFVVISSQDYEVYVNGLQCCMFNHRIPLENVSTISIYGDVTIPIYGFIDTWSKSFTFTDLLKVTGMASSFSSLLPILSEVSHPVISPVLPYVGTLRGGIRPDMAIFFQGTVPARAKRFEINFQTGQSDSDDIAFHFNPRIGQYVCLNSFRNASWETEETAPVKPFTKGAAFNMFVLINSESYEVHVNGVQLCVFKHRVPLENISTLAISGDISMAIYGFIDNWSRSPLCMDRSNVTGYWSSFSKQLSIPSEVLYPVIQPALPYMGTIKEEIKPDMAVLFHGALSEHGKSFEINLLTGDSDHDDIAFHISPRIGKSVALNSFINGSWETEEYASDNPFTKGASFHLFFVITSEGYEVYVNSLQHCTFKHRIPLEKVSTLGIRGDITINYFGFVENWSESSMVRKIKKIPDYLSISGSLMHITSEISHQVINPELPYVGVIPEGLRMNMAVFLQGALPADATEFTINLQTGESDGADIAFHIQPRIGDLVALNSFRNGSWEAEEHASVSAFSKEAALNMFIVIKSEGYEVYVNGLQHCTFKHRIPLEKVSTLGIFGDVIINFFGFVENWSGSSIDVKTNEIQDISMTSGSMMDIKLEMSHPISNPELPCVGAIPDVLKTDMPAVFQVALPEDAKDAVNLKDENWSESSRVTEINEIQDRSLTAGSLIDVPSEISHPISSPELPYVGAIPGGLKTDMAVVFQGALPADAKEFKINLQTGESDGGDIAFHINPRIGDLVALNSFRNGSWEAEEHASVSAFSKEAALNMFIVIKLEGYEVYVNGLQHCTFKHRIPLENVSSLGIFGDVSVNYFGFVENWSGSSIGVKINEIQDQAMTSGSMMDIKLEISHPISNPELPCVGAIPEVLKTDMPAVFQVALPEDAKDAVNLKDENWSESSRVTEINEIQDRSLTAGSLIDVTSEISHPISSPELPYVGAIPGVLKTDMAVVFQGALPADAKEFKINLQTGEADGADIAFHINPRIGDLVALNSFRNGSWEAEEHASVSAFSKEAALNMFIVIKSEGYEVYVNGLQHCTFKHRIPLENVSTLGIFGDVTINYFGFVENWSGSSISVKINEIQDQAMTSGSMMDIKLEISHPISNPELPCVGAIPEVLKTDVPAVFQVALPEDAKDAVNLKDENWSESSRVTEINEIQDRSLTAGSLIDVPSEISHPISSPELPYVGAIPGVLKTDMAVVFQGALPADAKEFKINLQTGEADGADIAFHINPRIGDLVALNSFRNGSWEAEEHASVSAFSKEAALNMFIVIKSEGYEVYVNGLQHCTFKHRIPLENVSTLGIFGDVSINYFGFVENWSGSSIGVKINEIQDISMTSGSMMDIKLEMSHPISNPELPCVGAIPEVLKTDVSAVFQVALPEDAKDAVNLKDENWSESSRVTEINEIQDRSLTAGSLIDVPSEISHSISSPELPYVGAIPGGLKTDMAVVFQGALPADAKEFKINLQTGESDGADIAFHINPRIGDLVALNSFRNGSWEAEEHASVSAFSKEAALNMFIVIKSEGYEVYVNGLQHCTFKHRIRLENVSTLGIFGDVTINYFGFVENWSGSSIGVKINEVQDVSLRSGCMMDIKLEISHPISNLELPCVGAIPEVLKTDMPAVFQVALPEDAKDAVNLKDENWSESSRVTEINEIQDRSLTAGSLIDVPSEISHPISSPELPYVGAIPGGLKTDMAVVFQGALPADAKEFKINLQTGEADGADIAFHINPRIGDFVALNSFRNGSWEAEEHASVSAFSKEAALNMFIVIKSEGYEVYVNGLQHCTFKHRIRLENVSTLGIFGDVTINYFGFVENWSRSASAFENKQITEMTSTSVTLLPIPSDKLALPFVGTIPGGIKADMAVLFYGTILADSNEFQINFLTGQSSDEIAFNINPQIVRFLVLSSFRNGSGESEDFASDKEAAFNMFVVIKSEGYEVYVSGLQYCMFKHRIPLETISSLGIHGDVFINFIGFIENWSSSSMVMETIKITGMERSRWRPLPIPSEVSHPVSNPALPYVGAIPGKARPDMAVLFQGALSADANEFTINFQMGESDGDDIAFHINPQLGNCVALNSFRNGSWDTEEFVSDKPFTKGAAFNMFVVIKSEGYEVYVNGLELGTFKHRIPLGTISTLAIFGDVSINFIGFIETWSKFSFIIENNEITDVRSSSWRCSSHQMISTSAEDL